MPSKRVLVICSAILSTMFFFADLAIAQMDPIYRFKGINIPVRLKIKDNVLEKSAYDLEFLRTSSPLLYFIKIMKGGKILDLLQGEEFRYDGTERDIGNNPDLPAKPTLKMTMNKSARSGDGAGGRRPGLSRRSGKSAGSRRQRKSAPENLLARA